MDIADFLTPEQIVLDLRARDKTQLLQELARRAAASGVAADTLAGALLAREQLGSTGLGNGFALPHARIDGLGRFFGLFVRLARPLEYDAIDGQPVDLVFLLLMPGQEPRNGGDGSITGLARVARRFREADTTRRLRDCQGAAEAFAILAGG